MEYQSVRTVRNGRRTKNDLFMVNRQVVDEWDDLPEGNARTGATFRFVFQNFSKLKELRLSPACYVRDLQWRIMILKRISREDLIEPITTVGFYLQCKNRSVEFYWSVYARASLRVISQKRGVDHIVHEIQHWFCPMKDDWGFDSVMLWKDAIDESKGYIKDGAVIFEVSLSADVPHGLNWDSKKNTGYVGMKKRGATCYMNSLLQTLFFTNQLRRAVFDMPSESNDSKKSVVLALKRVFCDLQFSDKPISTKIFTKSFGMETFDDPYLQCNVESFLKIFLDKLENNMKGSCAEGTISKLFEGKMISYVNCKYVDCTSTWTKPFYSIQLNVKRNQNIYESFREYIQVDNLNGYRQYHAGEYGLQDAEKGVLFASFPPVLYLHLLRSVYDPVKKMNVQFNNRFEFYNKINLDQYLKVKEDTPATYLLHAVFVQSFDPEVGYNVVYINAKGDNHWYRFDDEVISRCPAIEAIDYNFGGHDIDEDVGECTYASVLVYIRDSERKNVLQEMKVINLER